MTGMASLAFASGFAMCVNNIFFVFKSSVIMILFEKLTCICVPFPPAESFSYILCQLASCFDLGSNHPSFILCLHAIQTN